MFDCSERNLRDEIEAAIRNRDKFLGGPDELIKRTAGRKYRSDWQPTGDNHENHGFEMQATWVPKLVYDNPVIDLQSDLPGMFAEQVEADEAGLNQWIVNTDFAGALQKHAEEMLYSPTVALVTLQKWTKTGEDIMLRPKITQIPPGLFFWDPQATSFENCRFVGHMWVADREDLLKAIDENGQPKFNPEAIAAIPDDVGLDVVRKSVHLPDKDAITRKQIVGYEIYVKEKGEIYTLAFTEHGTVGGAATDGKMGNGAEFLRKPRKAFCMPEGPYVLGGIYWLPHQAIPLPILAVTNDLVTEINQHCGQASDDAGTAKRIIIVDSNQKGAKEQITTSVNGSVLAIPNAKNTVIPIEFPGAQESNLEYIGFLRDRLDRASGLSDTKRGEITGATATEIEEASSGDDIRAQFAQKQFKRFAISVLNRVLWLMHHSQAVQMPVVVSDPETGAQRGGFFVGGPAEGEDSMLPFESLRVTIEPYSMEFVDDTILQRRMAAVWEVLSLQLPMIPQMPWVKWKNLLDDQFEPLNIKGGAERYIDFAMLQQMQMMAMMGGMAPGMPGAAAPGQPGAAEAEAGPVDPVAEEAAMLAEMARAA